MRRTYPSYIDRNEEAIKRLESDLYLAREAIINLMPDEKRQILWSFFSCESRREAHAWAEKIAAELVRIAEVVKSYNSERAFCPLCGDGTSSQYESGFSLPLGLTRHLTGWGNVRQCSVVAAASAIARNHWNDKFLAAEREQEAKDAELVGQRKASEILFLIAPNGKPCLFDELLYCSEPRNKDEMVWAEQRLTDLGFHVFTDDRVKSYVDKHDRYFVYADPRAKGGINFTAYLQPVPKKTKSAPSCKPLGTFRIPDAWKNDLAKKYQNWIIKATSELT